MQFWRRLFFYHLRCSGLYHLGRRYRLGMAECRSNFLHDLRQSGQTSLIDPDAGTETYEYDVLDRIVKQTDAKGKVTTNTYDAFGKILSTAIDGVDTTYNYGIPVPPGEKA